MCTLRIIIALNAALKHICAKRTIKRYTGSILKGDNMLRYFKPTRTACIRGDRNSKSHVFYSSRILFSINKIRRSSLRIYPQLKISYKTLNKRSYRNIYAMKNSLIDFIGSSKEEEMYNFHF